MGDTMRQIPFGRMMDWILAEYGQKRSIFGIKKLYRKPEGDSLEIFGEKLELPFGPAAGPHTQLAQNIVAGYAAGARFFELKTVQTLDGEDLPVSKPCILAKDECYNVEWSTELYVPQALDEYIKAWYALKLLSCELGLGSADGFVFNMSVGYDLAGIKTQKIDSFIEGLKDAENTDSWKICKQWALDNLSRFKNIDKDFIDGVNPRICRSITLSTLHGCPPDEIERIAAYLISEKKLNTFVKCNPTLLGYDYARRTLDGLGFDYIQFDGHHFKSDLQFEDAVPMLRRLSALAESFSLSFGVKLTNTFPVRIAANELPGEEMYMSGRALFPLSIEVANRLSKAFDGKLRISYSGGADFNNISDIYNAGVWPITLATTLLKPGGYQRLNQLAGELSSQAFKPFSGVDLDKLQALVDASVSYSLYRKPAGRPPERKMQSQVPLLDCFTAPCRDGCPIGQDVPAYLRLVGEGKYLEALRVITERNPLPFITGTICSHRCMEKCTRAFYEGSVDIRAVKFEAAQEAYAQLMAEIKNGSKPGKTGSPGEKIAIVGGGPAGLSVAYFLAKSGRHTTIFEKRASLGGIVRHVIPEFRIGNSAIESDIELVKATGVEIRLNHEVKSINDLYANGFETIIVATGAWKPGTLSLDFGEYIDAIGFLEQLKRAPQSVKPGKNVVVIGGGNTAMDAARAAKRVAGVENVSIVYRRTKRYMPADAEELELALKDGVEFCELLAPTALRDGLLVCGQMELGAPDSSGRRSPVSTGKNITISADTVISAIGNPADRDIIGCAEGSTFVHISTAEKQPRVFVIGDAEDGPATVAEAIADALKCAAAITGDDKEKYSGLNINPDVKTAESKKGILYKNNASVCEPERCLECATLCECCVDVCPNRANVAVQADSRTQIIHIDSMCNECGNCEVFCPYSSAPYRDKFTLFACEEDFSDSENPGFLALGDGAFRIRLDGKAATYRGGAGLPPDIWRLIASVMNEEAMKCLLCP